MKKTLLSLVSIVSMVAVAVAGLIAPVAEAATLQEIQDKGKIVMATSADFPPFEWIEMQDGKPVQVGVDIDLAQLIADELGVELEVVDTSFDSLIQQVKSNKADISLAGMTYTEERANAVEFSEIYYETNSRFLVHADHEGDYTKLEDFADKKIGVQKGTIQESLAKETFPEAEISSMNKNGDLVEALKAGKVDAVLLDGIVIEKFHEQNADTTAMKLDIQVEESPDGFAVIADKGNTELMDKINDIIKAARESGELDKIFEKNLDLLANSDVTAE